MSPKRKLHEPRDDFVASLEGAANIDQIICCTVTESKAPAAKSKALLNGLLLVSGAAAISASALPGRALNTVCTAAWSGGTVTPGTTTPAAQLTGGAVPPCFPLPVTARVTVGTGANAGVINAGDAITGTGTNTFVRTSVPSVDIGVPTATNESLSLTFSQVVRGPYLFFTYGDDNTSFTFSEPFSLAQANNATRSGQTVTFSGAGNTPNDGFVVQMLGYYSSVNFSYNNASGSVQSVAFTAGANDVPAPLPLMGAGVAFGFSRRLRRRIGVARAKSV